MRNNILTPACAVLFATAALPISTGCSGNNTADHHNPALELYEATKMLLSKYTDSVRQASDSSEVYRLTKTYEETVTKLNSSTLPDTDLDLTQDQNDTIYRMQAEYLKAVSKTLRAFRQRTSAQADSTAYSGEAR